MLDRVKIQESFQKLSKDSLELAWAIGPLCMDTGIKTLNQWGFESFNEWILEDICNPNEPSRCYVSRSYAYELGKVGRIFYSYREKINELAQQNKMGIRRLIDLCAKIEQGTPIQDIEKYIYHGKPLPEEEEAKTAATDPEKLIPYQIMVKKGDIKNFHLSLFLYALINGIKDISGAATSIIVAELPSLLGQNLGQYERFRSVIMAGEFECRLCHRIPISPTIHHILPQSLGHGYGPQVILCDRPCHYDKVQPQWKKYCKLWGYDPKLLHAEADAQIKSFGKITENPYPVFDIPGEHGKEEQGTYQEQATTSIISATA